MRKDPLVNNHLYHIVSRSIAQYQVFNDDSDYLRLMELIELFSFKDFDTKYALYREMPIDQRSEFRLNTINSKRKIVTIIAFCIMPTHIHLLLEQKHDKGISKYVARLLNSYTRYFNCKHIRKGPLWEGRFKSIIVDSDEQLIHLTRYIHLNPSSAGLVRKPEKWKFSSYHEYLNRKNIANKITEHRKYINMTPSKYQQFVDDRISYQRELSIIKSLLIDNYTG